VSGYEELAATVALPDEDDRHVLAAAIRAGAQVIVTTNLKDFPPAALEPFDIEAQHPDAFVLHLLSLDAGAVARAVVAQAASLRNPAVSREQLLDTLESRGLVQSVAELRKLG
jgi:hypothetical protein